MKKYFLLILLTLTGLMLAASYPAYAQTVTSPPAKLDVSPVLITGYEVDASNVYFVQLYNNSSTLVSLDGWTIDWIIKSDHSEQPASVELDGWILPHDYMVVAQTGAIDGADLEFATPNIITEGQVTKLQVTPPANLYAPYVTKGDLFWPAGWYVMQQTSAGNYTASRPFELATAGQELYGGALYQPPQNTRLRVVEILASPRYCSPASAASDPTCFDYIKIYNPTNEIIDLSWYRLRVGWGNETPGINNSFELSGQLQPQQYTAITTRNDGEPYDIGSSGGYVWFEDIHGLITYKNTQYKYPDLSGSAYRGFSWALKNDGSWGWAMPNPFAANDFSQSPSVQATTTQYKPCRPGQTRNPATNRCRSTVSTTSSLVPCKPGQARNPTTNRCKSLTSSSAALKPCDAGEQRNPATNRCRKVAGSSTGPLPKIHDIASVPTGNRYRWWIAGGAVMGVLIYALYEWRKDVLAQFAKIKRRLGKNDQA